MKINQPFKFNALMSGGGGISGGTSGETITA